jgi:DNA-binding MarR family transcriptional regulator
MSEMSEMSDRIERLSNQYSALQGVIDETVSLFHVLRALAAQLHQQGDLTAARRGILRSLDRLGPQTVPQMARARSVSRQHIQLEVNELEADGLVELLDNRAHRRSRLVRLTPRGKASLDAMYRREAAFFATLELALPEATLHATAEVLQTLRSALETAQLRLIRSGGPQTGRAPGETVKDE